MAAHHLLPPKSSHLGDPSLHAFLSPSFSATAYLNSHLPSTPASTPLPKPTTTAAPPQQSLTAIASQTQSHISTLSAQTSRLSATLTALTDDILRCSSRLGYEVELLRGDANSLVSALSEPGGDLNDSIRTFLPNGIIPLPTPAAVTQSPTTPESPQSPAPLPNTKDANNNEDDDDASATEAAIAHLRTLLAVRHSLQRITQRFSLALAWPMPPSLLAASTSTSITSSLISVSSPSTQQELAGLEQKGQTALARIRGEIGSMLEDGDDDDGRKGNGDDGGVEKARRTVAELRECVGVWKGTGEERARERWVRELEGWVEGEVQRRRGGRENGAARRGADGIRGGEEGGRIGKLEEVPPQRTGSGTGFLRKLRDEIYLE